MCRSVIAYLLAALLFCVGIPFGHAEQSALHNANDAAYIRTKPFEERLLFFDSWIMQKESELGCSSDLWPLSEKAELSQMAEAYAVKTDMITHVLPDANDLSVDVVLSKARLAIVGSTDLIDPNSLQATSISFCVFPRETTPVWYLQFGSYGDVLLDRKGNITANERWGILPPAEQFQDNGSVSLPTKEQLSFSRAYKIAVNYLLSDLDADYSVLQTYDDIVFAYYKADAFNDCDYFYFFVGNGPKCYDVYINANTGEVYRAGTEADANG